MNDPHRRPLTTRSVIFFQKLAAALARARVTPNSISIIGLVFAACAGAALAATSFTDSYHRLLYFVAASFIQLRLCANMLDGMVAIEGKMQSPVGDLYNEIPDRIADLFILVAAGYACASIPWLGWLAASLAILTAYIRAIGKSLGLPSDFRGPMSKPHRMATLTIACLLLLLAPSFLEALPFPSHRTGLLTYTLIIICIGSAITCIRRTHGIATRLRSRS